MDPGLGDVTSSVRGPKDDEILPTLRIAKHRQIGGQSVRFALHKWAVLKRSFISQGRKELLTPALTHHLRGHSASLRIEIPGFCLRASLRWLTHLRDLLTRTFLWPPPFLPHKGGFIAWLKWFSIAVGCRFAWRRIRWFQHSRDSLKGNGSTDSVRWAQALQELLGATHHWIVGMLALGCEH